MPDAAEKVRNMPPACFDPGDCGATHLAAKTKSCLMVCRLPRSSVTAMANYLHDNEGKQEAQIRRIKRRKPVSKQRRNLSEWKSAVCQKEKFLAS
jgi:hypothetical protein